MWITIIYQISTSFQQHWLNSDPTLMSDCRLRMIKRDKACVWGSCNSYSVRILFYLTCLSSTIQTRGRLLPDTACLPSPCLWDYFVLLMKCVLLTSQGDTLSTLLLFLILGGVFLEQLLRDTWEKSTHHPVNKLSKGEKSCFLLSGNVSSHFSHSSYNHPNPSNLSWGTLWRKINRKFHKQDYCSNDTLNRLDLFRMRCSDHVFVVISMLRFSCSFTAYYSF